MRKLTLALLTTSLLHAGHGEQKVSIPVDGKDLVTYQAAPMEAPAGGDKFKGSNFIHPLKTPSGFVVTDFQPHDHLHHFGVWWPWKFIELDKRKILCWELQKGDGIIEAKENSSIKNGLLTESVYIDRKAPGGPEVRLNEKTVISVSKIVDKPARGYSLDLEISHEVAGDKPITVTKYRYSGFGFRGSKLWHRDTSTILTSEGADRDAANFKKARWIRAEGTNGEGGSAGVLIMGHPQNHNHPEKLRTWDKQHNGAIFINFNPVMDESRTFEPGKTYTRNYRLFVYDGKLSADEAEKLWKSYAGK